MIFLPNKKNLYEVTFNNGCKRGTEYIYTYSNTRNISIKITKQKAYLHFEMSKEYSSDDIVSFNGYKLFKDAYRKILLLHILQYNETLNVKTITVSINGEAVTYDKTYKNFPFMYSMLNKCNLNLSNAWSDDKIKKYIVDTARYKNKKSKNKTASETDYKNCALQAYMLAQVRAFETDRFQNLWTAMNAFYNYVAVEYIRLNSALSKNDIDTLQHREYKRIELVVKMFKECAIYPKEKIRNKMCTETNGILIKYGKDFSKELYDDSLHRLDNNYENDNKFSELYKIANELNIPLFTYLLLIYPYHLRCKWFHGARALPVIVSYNDPVFSDFETVNYFLNKFLGESIPKMFTNELLNIINDLSDNTVKKKERTI